MNSHSLSLAFPSPPLNVYYFFAKLEYMPRTYLGEFELIVMLAVIRLHESAYGVPIVKEIEEHTGREASIGSVYATLERLEQKCFISSSVGESTPGAWGPRQALF